MQHSYSVPWYESPTAPSHRLVTPAERSFSLPSLAVQQAFPVPKRRVPGRARPKMDVPAAKADQNRSIRTTGNAYLPRCSPLAHHSGCHHGDQIVQYPSGCRSKVTFQRKGRPPLVKPVNPQSEHRMKDLPVIEPGSRTVEQYIHCSPSPQLTDAPNPSGLQCSNTQPRADHTVPPWDYRQHASAADRTPPGHPARPLDAVSVEKALLRVLGELVKLCDLGDHDRLCRLDHFASDLFSVDMSETQPLQSE